MPNDRIVRAIVGAALISPALALAAAHASITVVGDGGIDLSESVASDTAEWNYQFLTVDVDPGQTVTRDFHYTVSIADDGLPAVRTEDNVCTPDYLSDCGPAATGFEQAYALVEIGRDHREVDDSNAFLEDGNLVESFHSITGQPQMLAGDLTYTATNTSPYFVQEAQLQVMLFALADVSAVPEPSTWAMSLLALVPLLARRRARDAAISR